MNEMLRQRILEIIRGYSTHERPIYMVGGAVRDALLNRPAHDLDFVSAAQTRGLAAEVARRLNGALYMLDEERQTARVVLDPHQESDRHSMERVLIDFAALRTDTLESDLRARDFTINAMAFDVAHPDRLIDPTGGLTDLREKRIRACKDTSLEEDPVRVLRAVRQALLFQFRISPETLKQMRTTASRLPDVSAERLRDELFRMMDGPQVSLAVRILDHISALEHILPELEALKGVEQPVPHISNGWEHTLSVVQHLEQLFPPLIGAYREETVADLTVGSAVLWLGRYRQKFDEHFHQAIVKERSLKSLLFLATLYHDIAKPITRTEKPGGKASFYDHAERGASIVVQRGRELALSTHEIERVETIVRHHMRVHFLTNTALAGSEKKPSRRSIYRFFNHTGKAGVDICLLSLADILGTYETTLPQEVWQAELEICRELMEAYWENQNEIVSPPRLLNGAEIMRAFHLTPGPKVGQLLEALREAQASGDVITKEDAFGFLRLWLEQQTGTVLVSQEPEE